MTTAQKLCTIDGCERPLRARGWCATHHQRWRVHGDPHQEPQRLPPTCLAPDCDKLSKGRYCEMHRARLRKTGTFDAPQRSQRHEHSMGYIIVKRAGHPAATDPRGWIYEHRAILFDAIGPGWHSCHHCGMQVSWGLTYPEHPDALVVDHLDEDRANNERSNLAASCAPCNLARSSRWKKRHEESA